MRRTLHRHPEMRFREHRTSRLIADALVAAGLEVTTEVGGTGVVATLKRGTGERHVAFRADMDALPVEDTKDAWYKSTVAGVSHACGHDAHVAIAVSVARRFAEQNDWTGRVSFIFQPAEETPFGQPSGARTMLLAGVLDLLPGIDALFALHCWPALPVGTIGVESGPAMGAKEAFQIDVTGRAAHVASPQEGIDAVLVASSIVQGLHQIASRRVAPGANCVMHVGTITGGRSQSIVADTASMTGTIRASEQEILTLLHAAVDQTVAGIAAAWDAQADVTWADAMPPVANDPSLAELARQLLPAVPLPATPLTADDFALFAERVPALYLKLGVRGPERGGAPLHSAGFDIDERALGVGIAGLHDLAEAILRAPVPTS
ncbi:MAG: M20 family metallopeptidase [Acidimicrobiia bacterium]